MMHTLFVREHNEIATELAKINPHWDTERIFQESRKIVGAEIQHITYNEFLPRVLGPGMMKQYDLELRPYGYYEDYNPQCSNVLFNEFATAAFRFGHSLIRANLSLMDDKDMHTGGKGVQVPLKKVFQNPYLVKSGFVLDNLVRGMAMSPMESMDQRISNEVANHLFEERGKRFSGLDLAALNIQRGRDHGIPSYNKYRQMCGLLQASDFTHLAEIPIDWAIRLAEIYKNPNDIDLFTGLLLERKLKGGLVGPTLGCLLAIQFDQLRKCDRYWYESGDRNVRFTLAQLHEIRKTRLSAVMCRNCDQPGELPHSGFDMMNEVTNPMTHCNTMQHLDLSLWRENPSPRNNEIYL